MFVVVLSGSGSSFFFRGAERREFIGVVLLTWLVVVIIANGGGKRLADEIGPRPAFCGHGEPLHYSRRVDVVRRRFQRGGIAMAPAPFSFFFLTIRMLSLCCRGGLVPAVAHLHLIAIIVRVVAVTPMRPFPFVTTRAVKLLLGYIIRCGIVFVLVPIQRGLKVSIMFVVVVSEEVGPVWGGGAVVRGRRLVSVRRGLLPMM